VMREDWVEIKMKAAGKVITGGTPSTTVSEYWGEGIAWITPADLSGYTNKYIVKGRKSITQKGLERSSAKLMPKGSVLFSSRAPIGYTVIAKNELSTNQGFKSLTPYNFVDSEYLYYYLKSSKQRAESNASGTTFKEISAKALSELPLPLAPLPEQRAIVAKIEQLFSELDNGIANLKAAKAKLEIYRQAVLKKAFEGELTKEWREKNDIERDRRKNNSAQNDSNNKPCSPNGWEWKKFEEITLNFDGKRRPLSRAIRANFKGEYPYYGACEIIDHVKEYIFDGEYLLIGEDGANLLSKSKPLAFVATGKFWVNNHAHIVQTKGNHDIGFLMHQFNSLQINQYVTGTAQPKLSQRNLNKIPIAVCSLEEQNQIVQEIETRLSVCDNILCNIEESLEKAEALRQSILKKAFEGKLLNETELATCRQQPDWEPAEKLLARIRRDAMHRVSTRTTTATTATTTTKTK